MTWRESILAALGLYVPARLHDQRVHDAANKEQVALSGLQVAQRRAERTMRGAIAAQQSDPKADEIRETSATLRQSIERHGRQLDAFDRVFKPKDHR